MKQTQRILIIPLVLCLCIGLLPMTALAADENTPVTYTADPSTAGTSSLTEKAVNVASWADLKTVANALGADECLKANLAASLSANSKLDLDGKTVILTTASEGISSTRTLKSDSNTVDPMFNLKNGASLTINGGENGIKLTDNNNTARTKSKGLIYAASGTTVSLSNVSFADFKFGQSISPTGYGAVYATGATVTMCNVNMTNCTGGDGVLLYAYNSKADLSSCTVTKTTYYGNNTATGGVVRVEGSTSNVTIDDCKIIQCGSAEKTVWPTAAARSG